MLLCGVIDMLAEVGVVARRVEDDFAETNPGLAVVLGDGGMERVARGDVCAASAIAVRPPAIVAQFAVRRPAQVANCEDGRNGHDVRGENGG